MKSTDVEWRRLPAAGRAMVAAIGISGVVFLALLAAGWGIQSWRTAAGVLVVACLAMCLWSAIVGERASREVKRAADRLREERSRSHR